MKYLLLGKGLAMGLLLSGCAITASAQKINENELKLDVQRITGSTQQLMKLDPVKFRYDLNTFRHLGLPEGQRYGFLSADVKNVFPGLVLEMQKQIPSGKNSHKTVSFQEVDHQHIVPVLVAALKEQQAEIELLKKEVSQLKQQSK